MLKLWGEKCGKILVENLNERNHLAELGVHVKVILMRANGLDFPCSGYRQIASKEETCSMDS